MDASSSRVVVKTRVKTALASGLSFIYGWSDGVCYMRYRVFPTMMTGNLVLMCYSAVQEIVPLEREEEVQLPPPSFYLEVVLSWMLGMVLYRAAAVYFSKRTATYFAPIVAAITAAVELLQATGRMPYSSVVVCLLAPVFAIGAAVSTKGPLAVTAHAFSGHLQNLSFDFVILFLGHACRIEALKRMALSAVMVMCFVVGAVTSVALAHWLEVGPGNNAGTSWLLTPAGFLMAILLVVNDWVYVPSRNLRSYLHELMEQLSPENHIHKEVPEEKDQGSSVSPPAASPCSPTSPTSTDAPSCQVHKEKDRGSSVPTAAASPSSPTSPTSTAAPSCQGGTKLSRHKADWV